ncbi:Gfo/Idh/MocA family protein [Exiguobacterium alkaliphilum]|uniref:Gfo/Idh/MocA family oxidoreductase n=1 Tax=Exiguobacterium alkaliphilum TaxID=1428684 RepID=A0ABT2KZC4_9BACL|nr:Gfo/Idh/MocA family oxidoreductase [Exiguobacterium alkaliphilum]MCT4796278.1 Gfo/Idh/MocA family oxidoreductase [Exiguobacterium alkaliphilum]QUE85301.1 Gfo/Idh/MocA family oxidoreductase [Exiguobacterium alkaliphilum]
MKLIVVGIGAVAKKAYLPVYAGLDGVEVHLVSRDAAKAEQLVAKYRFNGHSRSLEEAPLQDADAVLIHSATAAHVSQVTYVLEQGRHVFIDKPVTFTFEETERLARLAASQGVELVTGFNRRFATATSALKEVEDPNMVLIQKNRTYNPSTLREFIVEDFVHVVDTLRYLTGRQPIEALTVRPRFEGDTLKQLQIQFTAGGIEAIGIMNRDNGCTEEVMEVMSSRLKRVSRDVERVYDHTATGVLEHALNPWESNLDRRGFTSMIESFLALVAGKPNESVRAEDSLETHLICERIVEAVKRR